MLEAKIHEHVMVDLRPWIRYRMSTSLEGRSSSHLGQKPIQKNKACLAEKALYEEIP